MCLGLLSFPARLMVAVSWARRGLEDGRRFALVTIPLLCICVLKSKRIDIQTLWCTEGLTAASNSDVVL